VFSALSDAKEPARKGKSVEGEDSRLAGTKLWEGYVACDLDEDVLFFD